LFDVSIDANSIVSSTTSGDSAENLEQPMPTLTIHDVRQTSPTRPFSWEGEVQVGTNRGRGTFTVQHRDTALTLKAFGGRCYPPFPYNHDAPPPWKDIEPLIVDGLRQLMQRDTFKTYAETQGWTVDESTPVGPAVTGTPTEETLIRIVVRYRDGYCNRPVDAALREIPTLLADPRIASIEVSRTGEVAPE
jgi:hypothetical protein